MGPSTHTSSQDSQPPSFLPDKAAQHMRGKVDKIGGNHLSKNGRLVLPVAEGTVTNDHL